VLLDQRAAELRLAVDDLKAVALERPGIGTGCAQVLPLADELTEPLAQPLDLPLLSALINVHYQEGRSDRLLIACGNAQGSCGTCGRITHRTPVEHPRPVDMQVGVGWIDEISPIRGPGLTLCR
jgi:hypothetical protein